MIQFTAAKFTFPFLVRRVIGRTFPAERNHERRQVVGVDLKMSAAVGAHVPNVGVRQPAPVVDIFVGNL